MKSIDKSCIGAVMMAVLLVGSVLAGVSTVTAQSTDNNTFEFDVSVDTGFVGTAPESINGTTNPTLTLTEGEEYTVEFTNQDGNPHDFVIQDGSGNHITGTDFISTQGSTGTLTFVATTEMAGYLDTPHLSQTSGDIEVTSTDDGGADDGTDDTSNTAPTADAGSNVTIIEGDTASLDASNSSDADGDSLSFEWTDESGAVVGTDATVDVSPTTNTTFTVNVSNGSATDTDTVSVTVEEPSTDDGSGDDSTDDGSTDDGSTDDGTDSGSSDGTDGTNETETETPSDGDGVVVDDPDSDSGTNPAVLGGLAVFVAALVALALWD